MKKGADQTDKLVALRRIEGQIRGIHRMIEGGRYCVDILYAIGATIGALRNVESNILKDHLNACVKTAFSGKSQTKKSRMIQEIYQLLERIKK
jgi:DNA-binding FrmR family transcriptional regulator